MKQFLRMSLLCGALIVLAPSGHATVFIFTASLDGLTESPPVATAGTGFTTVTIDTIASTMRVQLTFASLSSQDTAAHIHAPTAIPHAGNAGVATPFPGFPLGVTSGTYDHTIDMLSVGSYNASFLSTYGTPPAAFAALLGFMQDGRSYMNIHTTNFPGGEIRGFLDPVPEPSTLAAFGLGALALLRRRK